MNFSFISLNCFRLSEIVKLVQRFIITNLKIVIILGALILTFYYVKLFTNSLQIDPNLDSSLALNNFYFDDNLDKIRNNLQYAVIIDAGSSGSRVYIYVWPPHSGDTRQLLNIRILHDKLGNDVYHAIMPGLSSCADNPSNSSNYIAPLLQFASENVPSEKQKETPLYILATAGMRLLDTSVQDLILDNLRKDIPKRFSFLFTSNNVQVISGREEGIYSWISINYLMGRFDHTLAKAPLETIEYDKNRLKRMKTIGMLEMGGASAQIAFEITSNEQFAQLRSKISSDSLKQVISEFNLGCSEHDTDHQYRLFVTSYLNLGADSGRKLYVRSLIDNLNENQRSVNTSLFTKETLLYDPCLSIDSSETINITKKNNLNQGQFTQFLYHLKGSGDFIKCQHNLKEIMNREDQNWITNGTSPFHDLGKVIMPFQETEFYGLSEFWYTMNDIYQLGEQYADSKFAEASTKYCSTSWLVTQDRYKRKLYPNVHLKRLLYQCFKSAWMSSILHHGFKMPKQYSHFRSVSMLQSQPVQWTLGALIFRTRFFPLRSMDSQNGLQVHHVGGSTFSSNLYFQYVLFVVCMVAVLFCICVYLKRLHTMINFSRTSTYFKPNDIETRPLYTDSTGDKIFINFD